MNISLLRLLQLASPILPVGAFAYSQGLEQAVQVGLVRDEETARQWIVNLLHYPMARFEAPLLTAMQKAVAAGEEASFRRWEAIYLASREGVELREETLQMGHALSRLVGQLTPHVYATALDPVTFPGGWAMVAHGWGIGAEEAVTGYLWSWCENQVTAAVKIVPLGQTAGQRILFDLASSLPVLVERALVMEEESWSSFAPGLAVASSGHETQYCRLFRS
ncbi:MAG: urease accessory protein UreF [Magnetococcales bacterium]|nr:urease accessory protein UreF [Magnetococcales bacterium]NGZ25467.1 urease accessory protein UreF [Magnetococcales bacterium]